VAKLHMYVKIKETWSKVADGDGNIDKVEEFNVAITSGKVKKGTVYQIRQGTSVSGDLYNCMTGADSGETAVFKFQASLSELEAESGSKSLALARDYRSILLAAQKEVSIDIDLDDLKDLKASNCRLCFAKKVGTEAYNVVWQSYDKYLSAAANE
jgi:hypothetical protein